MPRTRSRADFGHSSASPDEGGLTRTQRNAGVLAVVLVLAASIWFAVNGQASQAVQTDTFGGSYVLNDQLGPVVFDLASGTPSLRLENTQNAVGALEPSDVETIRTTDGTLLYNSQSGTFNSLLPGNVLVKTTGSGVNLTSYPGVKSVEAFSAGANVYLVRYGASGASISLVNQAVVAIAQRLAGSGTATVHIPGQATIESPLDSSPGGSVTAGGNLWSIEDSTQGPRVIELSPPSKGQTLIASDHGPSSSVAALGVGQSPSGTQTVALATTSGIRLFASQSDSPSRNLSIGGLSDAQQIVPISDGSDRIIFAYESAGAWSLEGVNLSTDTVLRSVSLQNMPSGFLTSPVLNSGYIYGVMVQGSSEHPPLIRINPENGGVISLPGDPTYPLNPSERPSFGFSETQVISEGSRVVFNNSTSYLGVVVFTDGSHPTKTFNKGSVAAVDPAAPGGVAQNKTTASQKQSQQQQQQNPKSASILQSQVNVQATCKNTTEKPHVPVLSPLIPSTHTVQVNWTYPLLSTQDCQPTTYEVSATLVGNGQPPSQSTYKVEGQTELDYPGLHPDTTYQFVVTAFLGQSQTSSVPEQTTTTNTGPDAPTHVSVSATGEGWIVSWTSCSGSGCDSNDSAAYWTVTGEDCGGNSVIGTPPSTTVNATGSTTDQAQFLFSNPSYADLVGDSLDFQVQGLDAESRTGDPKSAGSCVEGWRAPIPTDITLDSKGTVGTDQTTITATLTVAPSAGVTAAQAFGSTNTDFTYAVKDESTGNPAGVQVGNPSGGATTSPTMTVTGLTPGVTYTTSVIVAPVGHPSTGVPISGPTVSLTTPWPSDMSLEVGNPVIGTNAAYPGPNADQATFSPTIVNAFEHTNAQVLPAIDASGSITCGSDSTTFNPTPVTQTGSDNGEVSGITMDLTKNGGSSCTISLTLQETTTDIHGGPTTLSATLGVGTQPSPAVTASWANNAVAPTSDFSINVTVTGAGTPGVAGDLDGGAQDGWVVTATGPGGSSTCSQQNAQPLNQGPTGTLTGTVDVGSCVGAEQAADVGQPTVGPLSYSIAVQWVYLGATETASDPTALKTGTLTSPTDQTTTTVSATQTDTTVTFKVAITPQVTSSQEVSGKFTIEAVEVGGSSTPIAVCSGSVTSGKGYCTADVGAGDPLTSGESYSITATFFPGASSIFGGSSNVTPLQLDVH